MKRRTWTLERSSDVPHEARQIILSLTEQASQVAREAALLVSSELVTNALRHTDSERVVFAVRSLDDHMVIEVADDDAETERLVADHPPPEAQSGRGLGLVGTAAVDWGIGARHDGRPGKTVWAVIDLR